MAVKASHPWPAQQLVPAYGGNPGGADVLAATGRTCARGVDLHPAHTEGVDADECAIGERDPRKLSHPRIRAGREQIAKSLEGNWRSELLFVLKQEMEMYDTYQHKIAECDRELEATLKQFAAPERASTEQPKIPNAKKAKRIQRNAPGFNLTSELHRITGVDLSRIDGVNAIVAQTIISEVGLDMSRWKTEAHFASWLGLCPDSRFSGDKVLARGTRHVLNRAATALRLGASILLRSQAYPGARYRRLRS